jgi:AraC-like DNA-binding protein
MADKVKEPTGTLFLSTGLVLFLGRYFNTAPHCHLAASVTVSLDSPFRFRARGAGWVQTRGCVARPNAHFELDMQEARVVNIQLDPEQAQGAVIHALDFGDAEVIALPDQLVLPLAEKLRALADAPRVSGHALRRTTLAALSDRPLVPRSFDPRIARVLDRLKSAFPEAPTSGELAAEVGLSEGRLIHLFGEQLGVPLRRYVLSLRVRYMLFCLAMNQNLTDAAYEAGFSDSAHYSRVFREMYGFPPSKVFRSDSVQIRLELAEDTGPSPHMQQDRKLVARVLRKLVERTRPANPSDEER